MYCDLVPHSFLFFFLPSRSLLPQRLRREVGMRRGRGRRGKGPIVSLQSPYSSPADIDLCQEDPSCWCEASYKVKEMSKMLKWALARGGMALFVCHSAEHHFTEKAFGTKIADGEKRGKRVGVGVLGVTCGHTELCPLWGFHIDIWTWWWGGIVKSLLFFAAVSYNTNCFATPHNPQRQQSLNLPATWICMISLLSSLPSVRCFFSSPRDLSCCVWLALTFEKVLEWYKKKLFMTTGELSLQQSEMAFWKEHSSCILKC